MPIHSKLPDAGTTIFTVMSSLATELKAINLGQGFPDFQMNENLIQLVEQAMRDGFNQYAHSYGSYALREVLAEKIAFLYHQPINPQSQITVTPGGTYAIYTALTAVLQPGDEVIIFQPCYDSYIPNTLVNGAVPVLVDLQFPDYKIDWDAVRSKISPRTRMIIINSPHNPTGAVLTEEDIRELTSLVTNTDILILSDEVYEHLIFDELPHQSILRYPELLKRSFVCFSFGKIYHCTGWKLGYCVSAPELMTEFRKIHQFNCFSCHAPSQVALSQFLLQKEAYLNLGSFMQAKRDLFQSLMQQTRFIPLPSHGSYFQVYKYDRISDEADTSFSMRLAHEAGVAPIPLSAFYQAATDHHVVRFCFAKKEETLERAVEKLVEAGF